MKRALAGLVVLAALSAASVGGVTLSGAVFTAQSSNPQTASAVPDFVPPAISVDPVIAPDGATTPGSIKQGSGYRVYADVAADTGAPASGIASVTANVANVTGGSTAVALSTTGGPFVIGGHSYNYGSDVLTSDNPLSDGSKAFSVTATDVATNASTRGSTVTVDSSGPTVTSIVAKAPNGPGGGLHAGDTYYVFANASDPSTVASVSADIHSITPSDVTPEALATCSGAANCTVGGTLYGYRAGPFTSDGTLAEGNVPYSVTATDVPGNVTIHNDNVAIDNTNPVVSQAVIQKTQGGTGGFVKQNGTYFILANVTDASQATVTADVSTITNGATAVALPACSSGCTVDGVTYAYKSASTTVANPKAPSSYNFSLAATDAAGNTGSGGPFSVTVDNTAPTMTDIQTANNGATAGLMESSDTITYSYSEPVEPFSILTGWDGTSTAVTVNVANKPTNGNPADRGKNDVLTITAAGGTVHLGSVQLAGDYVTTDSTFAATMAMSGNNVMITLGSQATGTAHTETTGANMILTPVTGAIDRANNALTSTTNVTEGGGANVEF